MMQFSQSTPGFAAANSRRIDSATSPRQISSKL
jgi:hypothetical protein